MSALQRQALFSLLGSLMLGACAWLWFETMEKRWEAHVHQSAAARENPMLGASRLLGLHRHTVKTTATLSEALREPLPGGTLILAENGGIVTAGQAGQLLAWVRQGNTLIARPRWSNNPSGDRDTDQEKDKKKQRAELVESDPIGTYLGVTLAYRPDDDEECECSDKDAPTEAPARPAKKKPLPAVAMTLPGGAYPLDLDPDTAQLRAAENSATSQFGDDAGVAMRAYAEGKGHIVLIADNYFNNHNLDRYDHAELLLSLAQLRPGIEPAQRHVLIVQRLDMLPWYQVLWGKLQLAIISLGCGLLLLLWLALRRFGPLLPEPNLERRALIEHIDASGRWLWKAPGGRDLLLAAARAATTKVLQRRAPELQGLPQTEQLAQLAQSSKLPSAALASALHQAASRMPIEFTRQIQTLQQLRKHYER